MATAPTRQFYPSKEAQAALLEYFKQVFDHAQFNWQIRTRMEEMDRSYQCEGDFTGYTRRLEEAVKAGNKDVLKNIQVPIIAPQIESTVASLAGIFCRSIPIFPVISEDPQTQEAAIQMNTSILDQQRMGQWVSNLVMHFRDALKYNWAPLEVSWHEQTIWSPQTNPGNAFEASKQEILWSGTKLKRLDPYNTFCDMRVPADQVPYWGEYAGYVEMKSTIALKQFLQGLKNGINRREALDSKSSFTGAQQGTSRYFIPAVNPSALFDRSLATDFNWDAWVGLKSAMSDGAVKFSGINEVATLYVRIVPSTFKLNGSKQVQIWKLVVVNNEVIVLCEQQTNAHEMIPILFSTPTNDGLDYQAKSYGQAAESMQDAATALLRSILAARRRTVYDRLVYNPKYIRMEDINKADSIGRIPIRQAGFGKPLNEMIFQLPFRDEQSSTMMQYVQAMREMADERNGHNRAKRGQFTPGNRTMEEFDSIMTHGSDREWLLATLFEDQLFTPAKRIIKSDNLQYSQSRDIYNPVLKKTVTVNPNLLRQSGLDFEMTDGMNPVDKILPNDIMKVAMQVFSSSPQLQAEYDFINFFEYYLETRGLRNIKKFRRDAAGQQQYIDMVGRLSKAQEPAKMAQAQAQQLAAQNQSIPTE